MDSVPRIELCATEPPVSLRRIDFPIIPSPQQMQNHPFESDWLSAQHVAVAKVCWKDPITFEIIHYGTEYELGSRDPLYADLEV